MKRFTNTEKWSKEWFRKLAPKAKCFWLYLCDRCDNAGVWEPDYDLASFQIGEAITPADLIAYGDRIKKLRGGKIYLKKFIEFQYGRLRPECRPHMAIIGLLAKHCLPIPEVPETDKTEYSNNTLSGNPNRVSAKPDTLQDQDQDQEKDKDKDQEKNRNGKPEGVWAKKVRLDLIGKEIDDIRARGPYDVSGATRVRDEDRDRYKLLQKERRKLEGEIKGV